MVSLRRSKKTSPTLTHQLQSQLSLETCVNYVSMCDDDGSVKDLALQRNRGAPRINLPFG